MLKDKAKFAGVGAAIVVGSLLGAGAITKATHVSVDGSTTSTRSLSKKRSLPDGGFEYFYALRTEFKDGRVEEDEVKLLESDCVRRQPYVDADRCSRKISSISGDDVVVDPGEMNRFPRSQAIGDGCEPVACSISDQKTEE